jgi:hypothetical protein
VVGANPVVIDHLDASAHPIVAAIHFLFVKYNSNIIEQFYFNALTVFYNVKTPPLSFLID